MTDPALFRGVDRALFAASFAERLRRAGIEVAFTSTENCVRSIDAVSPLNLADAYWVLRLSFVTRREELDVFDAVFAAVFDSVLHVEMGWVPNRAPRRSTVPETADDVLVRVRRSPDATTGSSAALPWTTLPAVGDRTDDGDDSADDDLALPELLPARESVDMDRSFDHLDDEELERLGDILASPMITWPHRRSRRRSRASSGGRVALRRTMRSAMRTGGDVMTLHRERPRRRPRPLAVILDVSGSMERHARAYLHLVRPLAVVHRAEVFVFATDVTRVTAALRARSSADVVDHLNTSIGDRFSGTRIAGSFNHLLHHRTWSTSVRGAVVLICSDGWDTGDPAELDRVMRRMSLLAHRIVWVNPRAAADDFEPSTGGMSTALPYCDAFLAGNTGRSMLEVIHALSTDAEPR